MDHSFEEMNRLLYEGAAGELVDVSRQALDRGVRAREILEKGLLAGMDAVGRDFKAGELFVPEVIVASRAMHAALDVLRPLLVGDGAALARTIVLGTVKGDLHDIGKKLVAILMEGAGFRVVDLGNDVAPEQFVEAVRAERPDLLGMSALLSTTMPVMKATLQALDEAGLRQRVKVLVGGAPVTQAWCDEIGAHGYAPEAVSAIGLAKELTEFE